MHMDRNDQTNKIHSITKWIEGGKVGGNSYTPPPLPLTLAKRVLTVTKIPFFLGGKLIRILK